MAAETRKQESLKMALAPPSPQESSAAAEPFEPVRDGDEVRRKIEERIANDIRREYESGRERCQPVWADFLRWHKLYRGSTQRKFQDGLADVNVPITLENVEALTANVVGILFAADNYVKGIPKEGATEATAKSKAAILQNHLYRLGFEWKFRRFLSQWLIVCGTGMLKRCWKLDRRHVMRRVRDPVTGVARLQPVPRVIHDHVDVEVVDLTTIVPSHLDAEEIDQLEWIMQSSVQDKAFLKSRELDVSEDGNWKSGHYFNIDQIGDREWQNLPLVGEHGRTPRRGSGAESPSYQGDGGTKIQVVERWGEPRWEKWAPEFFQGEMATAIMRTVLAGWGLDPREEWLRYAIDWVFEIAGDTGKTLIRADVNRDPNNTLPYHKVDWIPLAGEFFGMGVAEIGESLHLEANAKANQALDERTKSLDGMKAIMWDGLDHSKIGPKWQTNLKWRRHGIVWTKRPPAEVFYDLQPALTHSIGDEAVDIVTARARGATAANDIVQGIDAGPETATKTQNRTAFVRVRLDSHARFIKHRLIDDIFPPLSEMACSMSDRRSILTILGEAGINEPRIIEPEDLEGEVRFTIDDAGSQERDAIYRQQLTGATQVLGSSPIFKLMMQEAAPAWGRELVRAFGLRNVEELAPDIVRSVINETDPAEENQVMLAGMDAQVKLSDMFEEHIPVHVQGLQIAERTGAGDAVVQSFHRHIRGHMRLHVHLLKQQALLANTQQGAGADSNRSNADESRSAMQRGQINQDANRGKEAV